MNYWEMKGLAKQRLAAFDAVVNEATAAQDRDDGDVYEECQGRLTDLAHELAGSLDWAVRELEVRDGV